MTSRATAGRLPFLITILTGSFLLFMVQPMVARLALPSLGGASNVWNSAMLVYQALLLGGYAYAHLIGRFALRTQVAVHLGVLLLAATTLPIALADLGDIPEDGVVLWVPALFLASIGPLFFAVSAQAPLIQRWFGAVPGVGDPYPLYAASNLGSFAGLFAYPLLLEPYWALETQTLAWALGYGALVLLTALTGWTMLRSRGGVRDGGDAPEAVAAEPAVAPETPGWRRIALWLALAAVPSGLMLSTTALITTDIVAMPLVWAVPLGLYLLSFTIAFAENRRPTYFATRLTPSIVLLVGGLSMTGASNLPLIVALASAGMLFLVAIALHGRLFDLRPDPSQLTLFYLVMSAGGALGGVFAALIAPTLFDWVWEHPLLVLAAAALLPRAAWLDWTGRTRLGPEQARIAALALLVIAAVVGAVLSQTDPNEGTLLRGLLFSLLVLLGVLLAHRRWLYVATLAIAMLGMGGLASLETSLSGARDRSYFGVYTTRNEPSLKTLAHGTTLHGAQRQAPGERDMPTTYYGPNSGVGLALRSAAEDARVGVVGLGVGTLSCYRRAGQRWTFFEIDPQVVEYSRGGRFTFLRDCAPQADIELGDARVRLAEGAPARFDVLAVDAFSSDSIPLHLLTVEAAQAYMRALAPDGLLVLHISNRYLDLEPSITALAEAKGLSAAIRRDPAYEGWPLSPSNWVVLARDQATVARVVAFDGKRWEQLKRDDRAAWTDSFASVMPYIEWAEILRAQ